MRNERIKSVILLILVVSNVFLANRILTVKKLWPDGYNFFNIGPYSVRTLISSLKSKQSSSETQTTPGAPDLIIVNTGYQSTRLSVFPNDELFSELSETAAKIMTEAFSSQRTATPVEREELYSALMTKSVYVRYPTVYETELFAELLGVYNPSVLQQFAEISGVALSADGTAYIIAGDGYYKIASVRPDEKLAELINKISDSADVGNITNYAFDLGFDKPFGDQTTVLSPLILIYSEPIKAPNLTVTNPLGKNSAPLILSCFGMNPNAVHSYTEADGRMVFVENDATLKLSPDGVLEYTAKDGFHTLYSGATPTGGEVFSGLAELITAVNDSVGASNAMYPASGISAAASGSEPAVIEFDYSAEGLRIHTDEAAVRAEISQGCLTSYHHILKKYQPSGDFGTTPTCIDALDTAIAEYKAYMPEIEVFALDPVYFDNGKSTISADWLVNINDVVSGN